MQKGRKPSRHVQPGTKQQRLGVCMKKRSTFAALDITAFGIAFHATREVLQCKSMNTEAPKKGLGSGTESASKQRTHKMSMSVLSLNNCAYVAPHSGDNSYYPIPFLNPETQEGPSRPSRTKRHNGEKHREGSTREGWCCGVQDIGSDEEGHSAEGRREKKIIIING